MARLLLETFLMTSHPLRLLLGSFAAVASLLVACSGGSSAGTSGSTLGGPGATGSTDGTGAPATDTPGTGFGCCVVEKPSVCTLILGRAKRSADDSCIDGYDGVNPDPDAPGWTQVNDKDGCPVWTPPPNAPKICCGCIDASAPTGDAGDAGDQ